MQAVKVFLRKALPSFDRVYTYIIPEKFQKEVNVGRRVLVPFGRGNRLEEAFIFSLIQESESIKINRSKTKEIQAVLDQEPLLSKSQLRLIAQMKQLYTCTYGQAASCILPSGFNLQLAEIVTITPLGIEKLPEEFLRDFFKLSKTPETSTEQEKLKQSIQLDDLLLNSYKRQDLFSWAKAGFLEINPASDQKIKRKSNEYVSLINYDEANFLLEEHSLGSIQQELAIEYLLQEGECPVIELLEACNIKRGSIKTLEKKNLVELSHKEISIDEIKLDLFDPNLLPKNIKKLTDSDLSLGQKNAINTIKSAINSSRSEEFLLHGITGSGKTEVYIRLCKTVLEKGQKALVLVPEIGLTPQMLGNFNAHFPGQITVLHSGLSQRERFDRWEKIRADKVNLLIGVRSAVFAPLKNLGLIIIDEEQEDSYISDMIPYYDARTIARLRMLNENCSLLLGSATPNLETYHRSSINKSTLLTIKERAGQARLPEAEIIDLSRDWNHDTAGILSKRLVREIQETLNRKEQVLIFMNRRGFASTYLCKNCGESIKCLSCSVGMTYHKDKQLLICHYCGASEKLPELCPECNSNEIILYGCGTQRLEQICKQLFPETLIIRMDQDTSRNAKHQAELLQTFRENESGILIGTQMIAKGHDFPRITLAAILSTDQMISRNNFRAAENTFQLITQAAGRAGRSERPAKVFIQAFNVDHYAIKTSAAQDYEAFLKEELNFRESLNYPPFSNLAYINVSSESNEIAKTAANKLYNTINNIKETQNLSNLKVLKAAPALMHKLQNRWRWSIVMKADGERPLELLSRLWQKLSLLKLEGDVKITFRLDPA